LTAWPKNASDGVANESCLTRSRIEIDGRLLQFERYVIGERILRRFSTIRLAVLMPEEHINRFVETMVRGAGAQMTGNHDRAEAAAWL
jgi:hypothetical protein